MTRLWTTTLLCSVLLALGCGARSTLRDPTRDGDTASPDAGTTREDAGRAMDAGRRVDGGRDAGSVDTRLGRALQCEMNALAALRAVVREVACWDDGDDFDGNDPTVRGLMEAWEAGLFGLWEPGVSSWLAGFRDRGCPAWRCAAEASSCAELEACGDVGRVGGPCERGSERCDGDVIVRCLDGDGFVPAFDCADVGARCNSALCQLDDCTFGAFGESLACEGDALTACDGRIATPCSAHGPGDTCDSFYIGGELPTRWCGPSAAGAYNTPVDCVADEVSFTSVSGETYVVDCLAAGYAGCDERGCAVDLAP